MISADIADGQAITQNSFFGVPQVARAFHDKHNNIANHLADVVHNV